MSHTARAWSLPNGHAGKQLLFLATMASQPIASNFCANPAVCRAVGHGWQRLERRRF
jgi:hypothetical protein